VDLQLSSGNDNDINLLLKSRNGDRGMVEKMVCEIVVGSLKPTWSEAMLCYIFA